MMIHERARFLRKLRQHKNYTATTDVGLCAAMHCAGYAVHEGPASQEAPDSRRSLFIIMAALCSRCGHYISVLFLSSFFPRLISAVADLMSTILLHMVWP